MIFKWSLKSVMGGLELFQVLCFVYREFGLLWNTDNVNAHDLKRVSLKHVVHKYSTKAQLLPMVFYLYNNNECFIWYNFAILPVQWQ